MLNLVLVGIGTGNPEHLTLQAVRALNAVDLILIPRKGADKADLAELRRRICAEHVTNQATVIAEFDLPLRDQSNPDYAQGVSDWHMAIAATWAGVVAQHPVAARVALLVWGDPSLYDSTLRIAALLNPAPKIEVIPGITSLQALTAAHAMALNEIAAPFVVTTGRRLRDEGWPEGTRTVAVMLDGETSFTAIDPTGISIWWGAYVGMEEEFILSGPLAATGPKIVAARAEARTLHGWIMDIYLLRKT